MNFSLFLTIFISETLGTVAFPGVHGYKTSYGPLLMEHTLCISKKAKADIWGIAYDNNYDDGYNNASPARV